jgi:hypothetical protein
MRLLGALYSALFVVGVTALALAQDRRTPVTGASVTFHDIAAGDRAGITYRRGHSVTQAIFDALKTKDPFTFNDLLDSPVKARGAPGVALFDFDGDDDLDVYVTNGPGRANSLYSNQLREAGQLTFVDSAETAGVAAIDQDSTGVCYGDIDNDGDRDLLVLGRSEPNRLFENLANGTFRDITAGSRLGDDTLGHASCAMGDVNGDGLLDVAVANTFDWRKMLAVFIQPFVLNHPNQLFLNLGASRFADASATSGIQSLAGVPQGAGSITWAVSMVDYDLDGDVDIVWADDQAAVVRARYGGVDRGFIHILQNDGMGHFTDVTLDAGLNKAGQWMGLAFGDFNCDGQMDIFGSNGGDYFVTALPPFPYTLGDDTSRWFLGRPDGTFADPGVGHLIATPFGWGTSTLDYDNDGDTDLVFHGGLSIQLIVESSNPGSLLRNEGCRARFSSDARAFARSTSHMRRNVEGMAVGDLNADGFPDIVSVSSFDKPEPVPLVRYPVSFSYGSPFDTTAVFVPEFHSDPHPGHEGGFLWGGRLFDYPDGTLSVEINSGNNGNGWLELRTLGTVGLTSLGQVNRDGIGAVVRFTPNHGKPSMRPVLGGSSYASQDSLTATFGLGSAQSGTVDVLWPGGVRNRLYNVRRSERIVLPEIPCSFAGEWADDAPYRSCLETALDELLVHGLLNRAQRARFRSSALRAFGEHQ